MKGSAKLDHLVVVANSLDEGGAWCEATLGVTPGPGGEHPLMGTHNRLLRIDSAAFPRTYLEIIAINLEAYYAHRTGAKRWFDMDNAQIQTRVAQNGPQLIHWVASVPDIAAAGQTLAAQGVDRGSAIQASRMTPNGLLQWQITVRDDGQRLFDGCLPTLIQWGDVHPTHNMPHNGVTVQALNIAHPAADQLQAAFDGIGFAGMAVLNAPARITAVFQTPKGVVQLFS